MNINPSSLLESIPEIVYHLQINQKDKEYNVLYINKSIQNITGYPPEEFYKNINLWWRIISPKDRDKIKKSFQKKITNKSGGENFRIMYRIIDKDGQEVFVFNHGICQKILPHIFQINGLIMNIDDEYKEKVILRTLTNELISAQETERKKISQELHDQTGHILTAIKINLQFIEEGLSPNQNIKSRLLESKLLMDQLIDEIRQLSFDLRPPLLDDLGLVAAVRWYIKDFTERTGLKIDFMAKNFPERLSHHLGISIYRIIQEALTNIARHAKACNIKINICKHREYLAIFIEDDGQGFEVERAFNPQTRGIRFGLLGIRERINMFGGYFNIHSEKGAGTRISIKLRLHKENELGKDQNTAG